MSPHGVRRRNIGEDPPVGALFAETITCSLAGVVHRALTGLVLWPSNKSNPSRNPQMLSLTLIR
jgi:hypothetical protein